MEGEIIETEFCVECGNPATCVGKHEAAEKWSAACDKCCGHGNEDGHCEPVGRYAQRTIKALQAALGEAVREAKSAKARIADACLAHNQMENERDVALNRAEAAERELAVAGVKRDATLSASERLLERVRAAGDPPGGGGYAGSGVSRQGKPCIGCGETREERRAGYWCCARCGLPCGSLTKLG